MKKSILAIVLTAMVSMTASAVSVPWSTTALSFGSAALKNNANVSAYLIALGTDSLSTYIIDSTFTPAVIGEVDTTASGTPKSAKVTGKLVFTYNPDTDVYDYENGDGFAFLVSYKEGEKTWWNLSSTVNTISGVVEDTSNPAEFAEFAFNSTISDGNVLSAGGGWVSVPEPATGALALAGLALLFRRKRA